MSEKDNGLKHGAKPPWQPGRRAPTRRFANAAAVRPSISRLASSKRGGSFKSLEEPEVTAPLPTRGNANRRSRGIGNGHDGGTGTHLSPPQSGDMRGIENGRAGKRERTRPGVREQPLGVRRTPTRDNALIGRVFLGP